MAKTKADPKHAAPTGEGDDESLSPAPDATEAELPPQTRKVRATAPTYYDDKRRRLGDVFRIRQPYEIPGPKGKPVMHDDFNPKCMEDVAADTPEHTSTGRDELRRQHDEILGAHRRPGMNVLGD